MGGLLKHGGGDSSAERRSEGQRMNRCTLLRAHTPKSSSGVIDQLILLASLVARYCPDRRVVANLLIGMCL
jgi:hypothetical protein